MRYVSPKYDKTVFETEDVLLLSNIINIEIEEDEENGNKGNIIVDAEDIFG